MSEKFSQVIEAGSSKNITATGDVTTQTTRVMGFYVNSTSAGTLILKAGGTGGTAIGGTITPDVGFHPFPCIATKGLHATVGGTLDVTFFYEEEPTWGN